MNYILFERIIIEIWHLSCYEVSFGRPRPRIRLRTKKNGSKPIRIGRFAHFLPNAYQSEDFTLQSGSIFKHTNAGNLYSHIFFR